MSNQIAIKFSFVKYQFSILYILLCSSIFLPYYILHLGGYINPIHKPKDLGTTLILTTIVFYPILESFLFQFVPIYIFREYISCPNAGIAVSVGTFSLFHVKENVFSFIFPGCLGGFFLAYYFLKNAELKGYFKAVTGIAMAHSATNASILGIFYV